MYSAASDIKTKSPQPGAFYLIAALLFKCLQFLLECTFTICAMPAFVLSHKNPDFIRLTCPLWHNLQGFTIVLPAQPPRILEF